MFMALDDPQDYQDGGKPQRRKLRYSHAIPTLLSFSTIPPLPRLPKSHQIPTAFPHRSRLLLQGELSGLDAKHSIQTTYQHGEPPSDRERLELARKLIQ
jgi:hypothetical protein